MTQTYPFYRLILVVMALVVMGAADAHTKPINKTPSHQSPNSPQEKATLPLGLLATFDRETLWRGYQVYRQVCASCHSMKYVHFRDLALSGGVALSKKQVKQLAEEFTIQEPDGKERKGRSADVFPPPFASEKEAKAANGGVYPPDLSVITRARKGGALYVYDLLTGYGKAPKSIQVPIGRYYNKVFPGHVIAMPPPLVGDVVHYEDGTTPDVKQAAIDVALFLQWAAEPHRQERLRLGVQVLIYTAILAILMFFVNRSIWRRVKKA